MISLSINQISLFLSFLEPFNHLSTDQVSTIAECATVVEYSKSATLFLEGEKRDYFLIVYRGAIACKKNNLNGNLYTCSIFGPGEVLGFEFCLDNDGRYCGTAIALVPTVLFKLPYKLIEPYIADNNKFMQGLCSLQTQTIKELRYIKNMGQEPIEFRIVMALQRLYAIFGNTIPLTKKEIGHFACTTTETVSRVISKLQKKGILISNRGNVVLKKIQK
ncbi:MAG: Crp/Fnr family transcriptional regulator [Elusimicrobia bacterium]|nr:Crp/Fnr family transcriptional regulator [Elusimicrobiota bacterium]